jgi:MFS family permease
MRTAWLLAVSWAIRVALCIGGGQLYWSDEHRYSHTYRVLRHLASLHPGRALDALFGMPIHIGFVVMALPAAAVHAAAVRLSGGPMTWSHFVDTMWIPAAVLSLYSVLNIWLVGRLADRVGAGEGEAFLAMFLMACCNSMFYWSRHLMPYDASLTLCLMGLWIGLTPYPTWWTPVWCGCVLGCGFLTHYGSWPMVGACALGHAMYEDRDFMTASRKLASIALGAAIPVGILTWASMARGIDPFPVLVLRFFVGQHGDMFGDYSEAWSLPWAYLWNAETGMLVALVIGTLTGTLILTDSRRKWLWPWMAFGVYALIVMGAAAHVGCAFGRQARTMVPFLCLGGAFGGYRLSEQMQKSWKTVYALFIMAMFAGNAYAPLRQWFPYDVRKSVHVEFDEAVTLRVQGIKLRNHGLPTLVVNTCDFYPVLERLPRPWGQVKAKYMHPLSWAPYQYEGYKPDERERLKGLAMWVMRR